jgi:predicted nucleotide-binding protein
MTKVRGLAWDDEPYYMTLLKDRLRVYDIELEIYQDRKDFSDAFALGEWDFVVLDLFKEEEGKMPERVGPQLARLVESAKRSEPWYPIFLLTAHVERLERSDFNLPANVILQYKDEGDWVALYIKEQLVQRGVYVDRRKVFQIHCSAAATYESHAKRVKDRLALRKIKSVEIEAENLKTEITAGLIGKMNECAAIIAICTPDDEWKDNTFHPRGNVLLEIGMALGLSRGLDRLIILQKIGDESKEHATLPTDLGGVLTIRFKNSITEAFDNMETRLQEIGVHLN